MHKRFFQVLIVDSNAVLRKGLVDYLAACDDLNPVGSAATGHEGIRMCTAWKPFARCASTVPPRPLSSSPPPSTSSRNTRLWMLVQRVGWKKACRRTCS
jgi:CheY-like chemotaxis protein